MILKKVNEAQWELEELMEAAQRGEEVLITLPRTQGDLIVQLVVRPSDGPLPRRRIPGSAKGTFWIADDFDAPIEDFEEYMR